MQQGVGGGQEVNFKQRSLSSGDVTRNRPHVGPIFCGFFFGSIKRFIILKAQTLHS